MSVLEIFEPGNRDRASEGSPRDLYEIRPVSPRTAQDMVVESHYLHRRASCMFAFGLYEGDYLIGCVIWGKPASPFPCRGIAGIEEAARVLELTRLWIDDESVSNAESFLIAGSIKLLPPEFDILLSYAEIGAGHVGTVYQATNWLFTGMSDRHVEWWIDGKPLSHSRHAFDLAGGVKAAKEMYGDRMTRMERPRKNRYIMFRGSKKRKKELMSKLRYPVLPYPKREAVAA